MAALAFTPRLLVAYARAATLLAVAASLLLAFLSAWAGEVDARDPVRHTLTLDDGRERSYLVYSPEPGSRRPGDVALVLHGSGGNAARIRALTARRFETLADEHRFLVLYPEGFEGNWNACRRPAPFSANRLNVDDVAFLRALVRRHAGSDGRVLAFGFSGGGHMALRLALEAPETVDAVAVVGANLPQAEDNDCRPAEGRALPAVLLINGTADPINPFDGGDVVLPPELGGLILGRVLSSSETARLLAERAGYRGGFSTEAGKEVDGNPATAITWARWRAANMPEVALVTVIGGGHTIPQPGTAYPVLLGPHSADIDAPREAWAFVQRAAPRASRDTTAAARPPLSVPPQAVSLAVRHLPNRQRQPKVHENG